MKKPVVAVVSFPGNNCEVESLRALAQSDIEPMFFRWNDDRSRLSDVDGYFIPGGFSYEDRGRSGMVAGRDSLMEHIAREAEAGKVVIGNCNGAQILVESGLIPLDRGLRMSLARNAIQRGEEFESPGFLSEWVWITPSCDGDRCATSNWTGAMHLPIAHGEGRFVTRDKDVIEELKSRNQLAFSYCDVGGKISGDTRVTPNGSMFSAAGICNPAGNVVALMPHPERTLNGKPYFDSLRTWIVEKGRGLRAKRDAADSAPVEIGELSMEGTQIFIDMIIVNNEERTVEQTARKYVPDVKMKQWKFVATRERSPEDVLSDLSLFNPNKERAFIRRGNVVTQWIASTRSEEPVKDERKSQLFSGTLFVRRDLPDTGAACMGEGGRTGICYGCSGVDPSLLRSRPFLEVLFNRHASELHILR